MIIMKATPAYVTLAPNEKYYLYIKIIFNSLNNEDSSLRQTRIAGGASGWLSMLRDQ